MARITVITHNHLRDGGQAPKALKAAGADVCQWHMAEKKTMPDYQSYDALVVLGGSMRSGETEDFPWLVDELKAIDRCLDEGKPILGVCLGAQMICELAGGEVVVAPRPERQYNYMRLIGQDPLSEGLPQLMALYNMHSDTMILPEGAEEFIAGGWCPQGVRFGPAAWGLQFHPEATDDLISYWHTRLEDLLLEIGSNSQSQEEHYLRHAEENSRYGRQIFANFAAVASGRAGDYRQ